MKNDAEKVWEPSEAVRRAARMTAYRKWLERQRGLRFADHDAFWRWSVTDLEASGLQTSGIMWPLWPLAAVVLDPDRIPDLA